VCNNIYEQKNIFLRNKNLYMDIGVNRVHLPSLTAYLKKCFGTVLSKEQCEQIAVVANGDARAALNHAKWWSINPRETLLKQTVVAAAAAASSTNLINKDASMIGEPPHFKIRRCIRAQRVAAECDRLFGTGDVDTPAQLLFENHCRYNPHDLNAAETLVELQSLADVYERSQREQQFEGADGVSTDKQLHFSLAFAAPCQAIAQATSTDVAPKLKFAFAADWNKHNASALGIRRLETHKRSIDENTLTDRASIDATIAAAASMNDYTTTSNTLDWLPLMFGTLKGANLTRALEIALGPASERAERVEYTMLRDIVARFARLGMDAKDFVYACQRHASFFVPSDKYTAGITMPPANDIEWVFEHFKPVIRNGDRELLDDTAPKTKTGGGGGGGGGATRKKKRFAQTNDTVAAADDSGTKKKQRKQTVKDDVIAAKNLVAAAAPASSKQTQKATVESKHKNTLLRHFSLVRKQK
jgi:hypothetical protein